MSWIDLLWIAGSLGTNPSTPPPTPIVNGEAVAECGWPSTVAFTIGGSQYCSATLIHPEIVLTAAHCIHPDSGWGEPEQIVFGETIFDPKRTVTQVECQIHPMYDPNAETNSPQDKWDLAWCRLAEPVTDIPTTPLVMGCEVDELDGAVVHVVGFGAYEIFEDGGGGFEIAGNGTKRHVAHTIEQIDEDGQLYLVGGGEASACSGDSGGSIYAQLADGSWRAIGVISRVHPDAPADPPWCLYGVVATGSFMDTDWIEETTGVDVTPCFDATGAWAPTAGCDAFPLDPVAPAGWADACVAQPSSELVATCGPAFGERSDTGDSGGSGGDETSVGSSDDGNGSGPLGASSSDDGDALPSDDDEDDAGVQPATSGDGTTTGGGAADDGASGCGCRSSGSASGLLLLSLVAPRTGRRRSKNPQ